MPEVDRPRGQMSLTQARKHGLKNARGRIQQLSASLIGLVHSQEIQEFPELPTSDYSGFFPGTLVRDV